MPSKIGEAILVIKANAKGLSAGLKKAQTETSSRVKKMQASFQGFANRIPVVGGALAGLATPAGAATAAIGLAVGVITKMVTKTLDLGRSLGTARETLGVSAEAIQIYRRAIEETNGDAKAFDQSVLRLTRSIGEAGTGNKTYQEDFERIGLSYEDLAKMSPENALKAVTGAINEQLSPADGAAVKAALLGRGYAGMGGFANLTTAEIEELTASVAESAVVMGGDAVTNVDEYDAAMRDMRDMFGKIAITVGTKLIPKITSLVRSFMSIAEALWPVISILNTPLKVAFSTITGAIDVLAKLLKGDFRGAWNAVLDTALAVMENIANAYNNTFGRIPGIAEIDMARVRKAVESVKAEVQETATAMEEEAVPAVEKLTQADEELAIAVEDTGNKMAETRQKVEDWYQSLEDAEQGISAGMLPTLADLVQALDAEKAALQRVKEAQEKSLDIQRQWYRSLRNEAKETQETIREETRLTADTIKQETDRINSSWDTFIVNQDEVVAAMRENSISFEDVVTGLADQFGISTTEMAERAAAMGITYGDTMAFMEAFGREKIAGIVSSLARLAEATQQVTGVPAKRFLGYASLSLKAQQVHDINLRAGNTAGVNRILERGRQEFGQGGGIHINGDVYGYDDFVDKVGQAGVDLNERGG